MKKNSRKLRLRRETLHSPDPGCLTVVNGASLFPYCLTWTCWDMCGQGSELPGEESFAQPWVAKREEVPPPATPSSRLRRPTPAVAQGSKDGSAAEPGPSTSPGGNELLVGRDAVYADSRGHKAPLRPSGTRGLEATTQQHQDQRSSAASSVTSRGLENCRIRSK